MTNERKSPTNNTTKMRRKRKAQGKCPGCGGNRDSELIKCSSCREKHNDWTRKRAETRRQTGACTNCGRGRFLPSQANNSWPRCKKCYLKHVSAKRTGSVRLYKALGDLFDDQKGVCALSGLPITLGMDAHLDHIQPVAKFPGLSRELPNLQWVHRDVNKMKQDIPQNEFIDLCRKIGRHGHSEI